MSKPAVAAAGPESPPANQVAESPPAAPAPRIFAPSSIEEGVALSLAPARKPSYEDVKKALEVLTRLHDEAGGFRDELGPHDIGIAYTISVHTSDGMVRKINSSQVSPGILERSQIPTAPGALKMMLSLMLQPIETALLGLINERVDRIH
jgi:hypothetical protein